MRRRKRTVNEFQDLMRRLYLDRDQKRGVYGTVLWMISEVGEFASAVLEGDKSNITSEAADVFAWLCSACNLLNIDLERASLHRYGDGCPKCHQEPCACRVPRLNDLHLNLAH